MSVPVRVDIRRDFNCEASKLFEFLVEHETLGTLFPAVVKFERIADGVDGRNSVGSGRRIVVLGLVRFAETYTKVVQNTHIEYVVSGSAWVHNHVSIMAIQATATGSTLHYTSAFDSPLPLLAHVIAPGLHLVMQLAFDRIGRLVEQRA